MRKILVLFLAFGLAACAGGYDLAHPNVLNNVQTTAHWQDFQYCGGWGCSDPRQVQFTVAEWSEVETVMSPPTPSAEEERLKIGRAIGLMETIIGAKTGYDRDRAGTGSGVFQLGQLDCYSEATNSSSFIHLLYNEGLIHFHSPADPIMRGQATSRSWRQTHATAALTEDASGTLYAMDSWFFPNGHEAIAVEADTWAAAWAPPGGASF